MSSSETASETAERAQQQIQNQDVAGYFAVAMVGIFAAYIIYHYSAIYLSTRPTAVGKMKRVSRAIRRNLLRKSGAFTSNGHALVFVIYIAVNLILLLTQMDYSSVIAWGKRFGWLAVSNIALITFLALKNTPLAFLTTYSYDRLNILHQLAGYTTILCATLHGVLQSIYFTTSDDVAAELLETANICGIVAGLAMLIILTTALLLRKLKYEIFYIIHIVMFMLIIITVGLHRPEWSTKSLIVIVVAGGIWFADRLVRASRLAWNFVGNRITLTPLQGDGLRVTLQRPLFRALPGMHIFLWTPGVQAAETHPFTIVSTNPVELVIKAHNGFTRDLMAHAMRNPGALLRGSVDGPYGHLPTFAGYDELILISGGSGASFTFGVALQLVRSLRSHSWQARPNITFIWVIRNLEMLSWYGKELEELETSPRVNISVYITGIESEATAVGRYMRGSIAGASLAETVVNQPAPSVTEKVDRSMQLPQQTSCPTFKQNIWKSDGDVEKAASVKAPSMTYPSLASCTARLDRPDIPAIITGIVDGAQKDQTVMVAACGPIALMDVTRNTVVECIAKDGAHVDLHCEQFGW